MLDEILRLRRNDPEAALAWYRRAKASGLDPKALGQGTRQLLRLQDDFAELARRMAEIDRGG